MSLLNKDISIDYPICAANGAISQSTFDDIDQQAAQLLGHDQNYQQLSAGSFRGRFTTADLSGDAWLFVEETNQALAQHCHVPADKISFLFLLGPDQWCRVEQDEFSSDDLAIMTPQSSVFVRCPAETTFCVITLDSQRLAPTIGDLPDAGSGAHRLESRQLASTVGTLRLLVGTFLAIAAASDNEIDDAFACLHLKEAVLSTLALAFSAGSRMRPAAPTPLYAEARRLIETNLSDVNVTQLCLALGTSRRTLEDVFRRQLGVGPSRFIKAMRLNQIRRVITADCHQRTVADIAAEWGIWHPSHFTESYSAMFGELPSQSRRGQSAAAVSRLPVPPMPTSLVPSIPPRLIAR